MGKLIHCLRYDLREGTVKMWPLYVLEAVFVAIIAVNELIPMKMQGFLPNVSELSVKVFEGFEKYEYVEGGKVFQIPMKYLLFTLLAGIFAVYYPRREWRLRGNMYLSRYRSKNLWWLSKCQNVFGVLFRVFVLIWWHMLPSLRWLRVWERVDSQSGKNFCHS